MAQNRVKTEEMVLVRIPGKTRDRAQRVSRKLGAEEDRDVKYIGLIGEILDNELTKLEQKLGL